MRIMERNKREFWYCLFVKDEKVRDEYGNETGERVVVYGEPVKAKANISPSVGYTQIEQFGSMESYDRVIVTDDMDCPINETSVLFVDKEPEFDSDGNPLYDYQVRKRAKGLNGISFAISKVVLS